MMDHKDKRFSADWDKVLEQLEADKAAGLELNSAEESLLKELQEIRTDASAAFKAYDTFDTRKKWAEFKAQMEPVQEHQARPHPISLWLKLAAAAAAILIVVGIGLVFQKTSSQKSQTLNVFLNDIPAGKKSATLTLDNGRQILLSEANNGQLAAEAGILISKSADGQVVYQLNGQNVGASGKMHTLTTVNGQTYRLQLPDHTEIWLNSASSIRFPASFEGLKTREVVLSGEAYFEIAKDKEHPFIVKTKQQEAQVLGTHFNINSYQDQRNTRTTLLEGSLRVINQHKKAKLLKPAEQSLVNDAEEIIVAPADIKSAMAWKNGYFRFNGERIDEVMLKISRWYNIEVDYQGNISSETFHGNISREKNISEVLNMLSYSNAVKFKVEGRRVTVMQ